MLRRSQSAGRAGVDRAGSVVEDLRPIVVRAMNDPELRQALRNAFETGREVQSELSGKKPKKAARKLAKDRKLQRRVQGSALELREAVGGLTEPKRGKARSLLGTLVLVGGAVGALLWWLRRDDAGDAG